MLTIFRVVIVILMVINLNNTSCTKESFLSYNVDTTGIAKVYKYNGIKGKDATVESIFPDSCFRDAPYITVFSWTNGGIINQARSYIEFDFSNLPQNITIKSAKLSLYWNSYGNLYNHTGDNNFSIYRVTSEWDENTITWNTQPTTTDINKVLVPKSRSISQSYPDIDVTNLVRDMINNPSQSHGFMLKLEEELPFKLVILASSDGTEVFKSPCLTIFY